MPRESPDAPEDLPKEAPGQVTFGQLEDEVPSMPDEPPAPIGQLVNTSQRAIYGINRDFRDRSVLRSSRTAELTT